jgi:hypothetical protein
LYGAEIGGNLSCNGGDFQNPKMEKVNESGTALNAIGAKVARSVHLSMQFNAKGQVRLYGAQVGGDLDCQSGKFESLDLRNASIGAILDDEESWPKAGNLFLDGFVYRHISRGPDTARKRIEWLARQASFTRQPYRQLAKVFREAGHDYGSRQISSEMERKIWEGRGWYFRPLSYLLQTTIGYGYFSMRALWWLLLLVILGSIVYSKGDRAGSFVPTQKDAYDNLANTKKLPGYYEPFRALPYSLENSFPLVKLGIQDKWTPGPDKQNTNPPKASWIARSFLFLESPQFLRLFRWLQTCAGWILATLFVGGVTGVIRKE